MSVKAHFVSPAYVRVRQGSGVICKYVGTVAGLREWMAFWANEWKRQEERAA